MTARVVEDPPPPDRAGAVTQPRSLRPHVLQLMVGAGLAGVVCAQAVLPATSVPSVGSGAAVVLLQASAPVFVALVTVVVLQACRDLRGGPAARFWMRCVVFSVLTYAVWSAIYFVADGARPHAPAAAAGRFVQDLLLGSGDPQLTMVFVAVQLCAVLPLVRWLTRITPRWQRRVLATSLVVQLAVSTVLYWVAPVSGSARLLTSYVLFVVIGALLVDHQHEVGDWIGRHLGVAFACALTGLLVAEAIYGVDVMRGVAPERAAQAVQPAVVIAGVAVLIALAAASARWEGRRRPWWQLRLAATWSDAVTSVYLVAPLLAQVGLGFVFLVGLEARPARQWEVPSIAVALVFGLPLLLAASWLLSAGLRRGPLSVPLTGRRRRPPARRATAFRQGLNAAGGVVALAILLALAVVMPHAQPASAAAGQTAAAAPGQTATNVAPVAPTTDTTMHAITVQRLRRRYEVIQPQHPVSNRLPVLVFLEGGNTDLATEEGRDGLLGYVTAGQAILVYPAGFDESWNDGTCCSVANRRGVDDLTFLDDVVHASARMRGADSKLVYLAGYGDGGKMAYDLICRQPRLVAGVIAIASTPAAACPAGSPVPLLQVADANDPASPYQHEEQQVRRWVQRDGCPAAAGADDAYATLTLQQWSHCARGSRVEFATYAGAGSSAFGGGGSPPLARVIMSFLERSPFTG